MENRFTIESRVRKLVEAATGMQLPKTKLLVGVASDGTQRFHEFDGVSPDRQVIVEIKTNSLISTPTNPSGRYYSAIKWALLGDIYMFTRIEADTKLLVLTDRPLFDLCFKDMDGLLPKDTTIVHCDVESQLLFPALLKLGRQDVNSPGLS